MGKIVGIPWSQGKDKRRIEEERSCTEQARKGCIPQAIGGRQEKIRQKWSSQICQCNESCTQGPWNQRVLPNWRKDGEGTGITEESAKLGQVEFPTILRVQYSVSR